MRLCHWLGIEFASMALSFLLYSLNSCSIFLALKGLVMRQVPKVLYIAKALHVKLGGHVLGDAISNPFNAWVPPYMCVKEFKDILEW